MGGDRRERVVVKLGGETLDDQHATLRGVADITATHRPVIVHGGGKRLSAWLARLGIESAWHEGRRITDAAALEVAVAVLGGVVNAQLVAALVGLGVDAVGCTGIDAGLLVAARVPELGRVARITGARTGPLEALLAAGLVPVVAPLALDAAGEICNVNADEVAGGLAAALTARLVLLTDTSGVLDASGAVVSDLDAAAVESMIAAGVISGGMIPKVRTAIAVLEAGSPEVVIADGRGPDALRRALEDRTYGTRLRRSTN
ncbi:MAG TPA: acetylglutamate kinase [Candidatus Dormibacteraeota bacterium]|nr:acetylglutamate kinase [Candidatus Dormibacteraeota bacterium]